MTRKPYVPDWRKGRPGESPEERANRLHSLKSIRRNPPNIKRSIISPDKLNVRGPQNDTSDYWKDHPKIEGVLILCMIVSVFLLGLYLLYLLYWSHILRFIKREYVLVIWALVAFSLNSLLLWEREDDSQPVFELLMTFSFNLVCQSLLALGLLWLLFAADPLEVFRIPFSELTLGLLLLGLLKIAGIVLIIYLYGFAIFICIHSTREYRQSTKTIDVRWKVPILIFLCGLLNAAFVDTVLFRLGKLLLARYG
jgi:hypothetical protein